MCSSDLFCIFDNLTGCIFSDIEEVLVIKSVCPQIAVYSNIHGNFIYAESFRCDRKTVILSIMCNPFLILNKWCIFASGKNFPYIVIIAQCIVFFVRTVAVYREPLQFNCFWEVYQLEELTERVRKNPWSVVLLDELEKAHRDVWSILLQVMEEGVLTDAQGRRTDFRNTVLVMTSNLGAQHFRAQGRLGFLPEEGTDRAAVERAVLAESRRTFAPEFLNRLDGTLVFHPLDGDSLAAITRQLLDQTGERLSALGVSLQVEEEAVRLLARAGSDRDYGARPLRRAIAAQVEDPAADLLLEGALCSGGTLRVVAEGDRVQVRPAQRQMENDAHSEI